MTFVGYSYEEQQKEAAELMERYDEVKEMIKTDPDEFIEFDGIHWRGMPELEEK